MELRAPRIDDGRALWRLAADSGTLDLNSSYAYLLWCRDFAATSIVAAEPTATGDGDVVGYVTGYRRPDEPTTLFVWQVAVAASHRGQGLAGRLLDELVARLAGDGVDHLETTITPDNAASVALFASFARRHDAAVEQRELFAAHAFPDGHQPEVLHRIGPLVPGR